jgi:signal transduction histidine kinase
MIYRFSHIQLIRLAGLFIWLSLSVPLVLKIIMSPEWLNSQSILWLLAHIAFGAGFLIITRNLGHLKLEFNEWVLLFAMIAVIYIVNWSTASMNGIIYSLIIVILLPWIMPVKQGVFVLILQNALIGWQLWIYSKNFSDVPGVDQIDSIILEFFSLGISAFSYILSLVACRQQNAKEELRKLNSELRATHVLLADSSRINERLRISRELHDLIGHHLTALSLNLEVASHLTEGKAKEQVVKSQSLARLLLSDVREVVSSFRNKDVLNFSQALKELIGDIPRIKIHLYIDENITVDDPKLAQNILRCIQEIITNCIKHANANNLWISLDTGPEQIIISIKDDGKFNANQVIEGNGLTGIRERVKQFNGDVKILPQQTNGLSIEMIFRIG